LDDIAKDFFPRVFEIVKTREETDEYKFELLSKSKSANCPRCSTSNKRAHSYQERNVRDLPILGKSVTLLIIQKRYFCDNRPLSKPIKCDTL